MTDYWVLDEDGQPVPATIEERKDDAVRERIKQITPDDVRRLVEGIRLIAHDDQRAHEEESELYKFVLQTIADGHGDPASLAREALKAAEIEFPRWCA